MRRILIRLVVLVAVIVAVAGGVVVGHELADANWRSDVNRLGAAMRRLDQDIREGRASRRDADYFVKLTDLPMEHFDASSVTYYVGPVARHSATIEFDDSGVKGVSVR